jgi:hypothetical protein
MMPIFHLYVASNISLVDSSEVHLNCMKVVGSTKNIVSGGGIGSEGFFDGEFNGTGPLVGIASETSCGNSVAMVSAVFMMPMILQGLDKFMA